MRTDIQDVIQAFGCPSPPETITQEPFDDDASHYRRLCRYGMNPDPADLRRYADDLTYQEIQPDLFLFLFPVCLAAWQQDLMASHASDYAGFVEQFSAALAKHAGFRDVITPARWQAVSNFMRRAILDKIDQERELSFSGMRATPYAWIYTMGTFGIVYPAIGELWTEWWRCGMPGRACGVLQYASVLMYPDEANPIFSPWTPDAGGGPPVPWETDGLIFDKPWLPENVDFLRTTLTTNYVWQAISTAAAVLHGASDASVAEGMVDDFEGRAAFVECRIQELIQYLSLPLGAVRQWITT